MCGIAGYAGPGRLDLERVERCLDLMEHRGPDARSHKRFELAGDRGVELLHTRLSIIDVDHRSDQPFHDGATWLAFNGELYNYLELRAGLEGLRTESDTEVLARVLDRSGIDGLDGCEGMWALAAFHERDGRLVLARDRFGEKPLYLLREAGGLYWGSEVKFIAALLGRPLPINKGHLHRFLVNGYKSLYKRRETFFEGVEELPAGGWLRVAADGSSTAGRYWDRAPAAEEDMSFEEAVAGTRERLVRSMELRLRADVPLAFCMSGGIDSLSLISAASRELGHDVHGFTVVNSDERYEEAEMVDHAVAELGVRHTTVPLSTERFLPRMRDLVRHHDAPPYTISYYAHWLLMEAIRGGGYKVSVSGTAADELFTGYYDHHLLYLAEPGVGGAARRAWEQHVKPVVRNPFLKDADRFVRDPGFRDHIYLDAKEFGASLAVDFDEPFAEKSYAPGLLRNRMANELFHESVPVILHEDDLNAMYFSIENRSPFLDRELYEFSTRIPARLLVRDGYAKAVLREAMRGIVPDRILNNRRKVGFNAPLFDFLDVSDASVREELLADSPVFEHVRRERIAELLDMDSLPNSKSKFLFNFLGVKLFLEELG